MTQDLRSFLVRVLDATGTPQGAGFLVGERDVLTCAHVVAAAAGADAKAASRPSAEVTVDLPLIAPGLTLRAEVAGWLPRGPAGDGDVALLRLRQDAPAAAKAARLVTSHDVWGHEFRTFGYPAGLDDGQYASGRLLGVQGTRWLQVEDVKETGARVRRGFSGAPVYDERLDGVVGMVVAEGTSASEKTAYVIPSEDLVAVDDGLQERLVDLDLSDEGTGGGGAFLVGGLQSSVGRAADATAPAVPGGYALPAPPPLVGRDAVLAAVAALHPVAPGTGRRGGLLRLTGQRGAGTSALAITIADQWQRDFADGCVYVDTRAADASALPGYDVLGRVLRALGVDDVTIPRRTVQRQQLLRALLARRQVLVVVDNVEQDDFLDGLVTSSEPSLLVVTTGEAREGRSGVDVPPLDRAAALTLLTRAAGRQRAADDPKGIESLATFSGGLPLVLHILAQRLERDARLVPGDYALELMDRRVPLSQRSDGLDVIWRTLSADYDQLPAGTRRVLRHLGLVAAGVIHLGAAAALAGVDEEEARASLDVLRDAHLVDELEQDRYRFSHSMVQLFAHERLAAEEGRGVEDEAKQRLVGWVQHWAHRGAVTFDDVAFDDADASSQRRQRIVEHLRALGELEPDVVAAAERLRSTGAGDGLARLALDLALPSRTRPGLPGLDRVLTAGAAAARDLGRDGDATRLELALGVRELRRGDAPAAVSRLSDVLDRSSSGMPDEQVADALVHLGVARLRTGALQPAIDTLRDALFAARRAHCPRPEATAQLHLSMALGKRREWSSAAEAADGAVRVARELEDPSLELAALLARASVGAATLRTPFQAATAASEALSLARTLDDVEAESLARCSLGLALTGQGRWKQGADQARQGVGLARQTGNPEVLLTALTAYGQASIRRSKQLPLLTAAALSLLLPKALGNLAGKAVRFGSSKGVFGSRAGMDALLEAAELAASLGNQGDEAELRSQVAFAMYRTDGQTPEVLLALLAAVDAARKVADSYLVARALLFLGGFHARRGLLAQALPVYREALELAERSGDAKLVTMARRRVAMCTYLYEAPKDAVLKLALEQRERWRKAPEPEEDLGGRAPSAPQPRSATPPGSATTQDRDGTAETGAKHRWWRGDGSRSEASRSRS